MDSESGLVALDVESGLPAVMYKRGDRVRVHGFAGKRAVLRVWEDKGHGLLLCSEAGYQEAIKGGELIAVGFPIADIEGPERTTEPMP